MGVGVGVRHIGSSDYVFPDQRFLLENYELPKFVLFIYADEDLLDKEFELCYEFLTLPSAQVLSSEQQDILNCVNHGKKPQQNVLELGLQLYGCDLTKELLAGLRSLLERIEATDRTDPEKFP